MRKALFILLIILFCLPSLFASDKVPNTIIVKFKPSSVYKIDHKKNLFTTNDSKLAAIIKKAAIKKITSFLKESNKRSLKGSERVKHLHFLQLENTDNIDIIINDLEQTGLFEYVEKDQMGSSADVHAVAPSDTYVSRQWGLKNDGTFNFNAKVDADVDMDEAWSITTGSNGTVICILDTGLKLDHPEFSGRLWTNKGEIPNNSIDDDGNGYVDDINGWDWVNRDSNPTDDQGHGTNVTGIAAANGNNHIGYAGVNWNCQIMVGKVLDASNFGFYSWWIDGIYYAVNNGAHIINMSMGGTGYSQAMKDACDFAHANNVAIFVSMANANSSVPYYPAAYSSTIAVGATDVNDYRASFSSFGAHNDFVAPGVSIYGLWYASNTNYEVAFSGTSMAAPLAAGIGSLILAISPNISVEQMRSLMRSTAEDQVGNPNEDIRGWDQYMGAGRLNAFRALNSICTTKLYYLDNDKDGYGDAQTSQQACTIPAGYVENDLDCNDNDNTVYPGAVEICDDKDNNCNGTIDEGFTKQSYYQDLDGDGFGDSANSIKACLPPARYVTNATDNCPSISNFNQKDLDQDGIGDVCDPLTNVQGAINAMICDINAMVNQVWKYSLIVKLYAAEAACAFGKINAAVNQLNAFTKQVEAKRGKGLTNAQEDDLIMRAKAILDAMKNGTTDCCSGLINSTNGAQKVMLENHSEVLGEKMSVIGYPNPSAHYFTLQVRSNVSRLPITVSIIDPLGRSVEVRRNVAANSTLRIGDYYRVGVYYAQVTQGSERVVVKLVKGSD